MTPKPKTVELAEVFNQIQAGHDRVAAAAPETMGACIRTDPQTNQSTCVFTDPTTCANIGGTFLGGPCGGF